MVESGRLEGQEARYFQEVEFAIAGFWNRVSCKICLHERQCLLLLLVLDSLGCSVIASLVVA